MYIVNVALDIPLYTTFSYTSETKLTLGQRVLVEFGNRKVIGFVWDTEAQTAETSKLKPILQVYHECLTKDSCDLIKFTANYYHYSVGSTIFTAIPKALKQAKPYIYKPKKQPKISKKSRTTKIITLNQEQSDIVEQVTLKFATFHPSILYGVTGSGKTEVYLELIARMIAQGLQVLVLVPEINLTPQMLERFSARFNGQNITVLTSHTTGKGRNDGYFMAQNGETQIVIGTRLSVFTPFKQLGLIIVDEEHDQSFKQNDTLRYHARDLAIWRANKANVPIILGSATPSLETLYNYKLERYRMYKLISRGVSTAVLPHMELIDVNTYPAMHGLTDKSIKELSKNLANNELSLVFINRRGYSPIISCYDCGWIGRCKRCSTTLVYHSSNASLKCHHCGYSTNLPHQCPKCNSQHMQVLGEGTQKIEAYLSKLLPSARIYRTDQDTVSGKKAWDELYGKIHNHEIDILVGTQMLAKGHDFHNLTLVIGINIDNALFSYDFRASELLYTQLTQVSGRAGRGEKAGRVFLQTRYPEHELYKYLLEHDFSGFVNYLLQQRKALNLPPYSHYAIFRASGQRIEQVLDYLSAVNQLMHKIIDANNFIIYPPVPSIIQRLKNKERGQILIHATNRNLIHQMFNSLIPLLQQMKPRYAIKWSIDVDPYDM
jgi:primosomal protein N' (replication factor Y) (superfamily II helicase)